MTNKKKIVMKKHRWLFIGIGIVAAAGLVWWLWPSAAPPALTVTAWNTTANPGAPFGSFTFGNGTGSTSANGTVQGGNGWTAVNNGNTVSISYNGAPYETVTLSGMGPVQL